MSDYLEIQHGFQILSGFFFDETRRKKFTDALDACLPSAAIEAIEDFRQWWGGIRFSTYITSISEHDGEEDSHGRLSMWRAFGGNVARVAVVFKLPWFSRAASALGAMFRPVAYLTEQEVLDKVIPKVIENIRSNHDFLRSAPRPSVVMSVFEMLVAGVCCLKHEGFREEREWRITCNSARGVSPLIERSIETVGGVPQTVYKLPLDVTVSDSLTHIDLSRIFDRLIIGPSPFALSMYQPFVTELKKAGVSDAEQRVVHSGIPIRS